MTVMIIIKYDKTLKVLMKKNLKAVKRVTNTLYNLRYFTLIGSFYQLTSVFTEFVPTLCRRRGFKRREGLVGDDTYISLVGLKVRKICF